MKHLLIICSLLLSSISWSEDSSIWSTDAKIFNLVEREGLYYKRFSDIPFTAKVNATGDVNEKIFGEFKNGKREGKWTVYFVTGILWKKYYFKDGKLDGEYLLYSDVGKLKATINYKNGKKDGQQFGYHQDGQLGSVINFKNGKREGEFLSYDEDGNLVETKIYKDDKLIEKIEH